MARQINFFASRSDECVLLHKVEQSNWYIIDEYATKLTVNEALNSEDAILFFVNERSRIITRGEEKRVDSIKSDVIEFRRSLFNSGKTMTRGRLWAEMIEYDESVYPLTRKVELEKYYDHLVRWSKKLLRIDTHRFCYIWPDAYRLYKNEGVVMLTNGFGARHSEFE